MDEELAESKLLLVKKGTAIYDLEFVKSILDYYGFSVKEFPSGYASAKSWQEVYDKNK